MHVHRANIKSALKSTGREWQYVSRPGIVSREILVQSASTERLKFIVHGGVAMGGLASGPQCDHGTAQNGNHVSNMRLYPSPGSDERGRVDRTFPDSLSTLRVYVRVIQYFTTPYTDYSITRKSFSVFLLLINMHLPSR